MGYLKKKKMYEIVQKIADLDCEVKLAQCEYCFSRGMEWLKLHDNSYIYELCVSNGGSYIALNKYADDIWDRRHVFRHVYNGFGKHELDITNLLHCTTKP